MASSKFKTKESNKKGSSSSSSSSVFCYLDFSICSELTT